MGLGKTYSVEEIEQLYALKKSGKTWDEIGEIMRRSSKSLSLKYSKLRHGHHKMPAAVNLTKLGGVKTFKRKYNKRQPEVATIVAKPHRPMIALVGEPNEVTATIKELFS